MKIEKGQLDRKTALQIYAELVEISIKRIRRIEDIKEQRRWVSALGSVLSGASSTIRDADIAELKRRIKKLEETKETPWKPTLVKKKGGETKSE